jgi:hypothetical protein
MLTTPPTAPTAPAGAPRAPAAARSLQPPATRATLSFPAQFVLWALRALAGERGCHATILERVAWSCGAAGVHAAFPALVGLAACLGRGPWARRFDAPAAVDRLDPAELAVLLLVRDAVADRHATCTVTAGRLVRRADVGAAVGYALAIGAELAVAGLPVDLAAPVVALRRATTGRGTH